jgi:hypothetical protein
VHRMTFETLYRRRSKSQVKPSDNEDPIASECNLDLVAARARLIASGVHPDDASASVTASLGL